MNKERIIFILLFLLFIAHLLFRIYSYRSDYTKKYDAQYWKKRYLESQWVTPHSTNPIGDDGVYAYVGWEYIQGKDPTLINADVPPFGKYLIGFSTELFKNQAIIAIITGLFSLVMLYFLNTLIVKDKLLAFLPIMLFSFEPVFYSQIRAPYLDTLYLGLLASIFYFFLKEKYIASGISFGLMMSTKSTAASLVVVSLCLITYIVLKKDIKALPKLALVITTAGISYLLTYFQFFALGHSIIDFLKVQKWVLNYYATGAKGVLGDVFSIVLTGVWHTWWDATLNVSEWSILWTILFSTSVIFSFYLFYHKLFNRSLLVVIWIIVYLLFLSLIPIWPRYLLLLIPFMYNLFIWLPLILRDTKKNSSFF